MQFDLHAKTAQLSVGELADFSIGPRESGEGSSGIWRAQLGSHWHREMQAQTESEQSDAKFEVPIDGEIFHRGWTIRITGRIDQWLPGKDVITLREIKTLTRPVPVPEPELRADYPHYFAQLATYLALRRIVAPETPLRGELVFVETGTGLSQTLVMSRSDETLFETRLERVTQFLDLNFEAMQRRRNLRFSPAFSSLRPGQEDTRSNLEKALAQNQTVTFEAPTGFGKTGVMLEAALNALKQARCDRVLYLTSKSTGQLQVVSTLNRMTAQETASAPNDTSPTGLPLAVWHVRNKREHCVNHTFHCVREQCRFIQDIEARWPTSGLDRFHLFDTESRALPGLRSAGSNAGICPYEITRTALAFQDVWVGDYNYVFAPRNRGLFENQPSWNPGRTLLIVDEAHNLPSRAADALSHELDGQALRAVLAELDHQRVSTPLLRAWESLTLLVASVRATEALDIPTEEDLIEALDRVSELLNVTAVDYGALAPDVAATLWQPVELCAWHERTDLTKLIWAPRDGEIHLTCLDAAGTIGRTLREFKNVVLASATVGPPNMVAASIGLDAQEMGRVQAITPWRDGAYDVAVDLRVDTRYQQRAQHHPTTAKTVAALVAAAGGGVAVFFPSYRYADTIAERVEKTEPGLKIALQPRLHDLAAQTNWVEESLALADVIFLVLGSSFAEGIDLLGGRISHAMVIGPALPEVNPKQRAWLAELERESPHRDEAFDRVYRMPGLQKVNQGLGRLVRAPGHRTRVLLHCQRFIDPGYAQLLAPDYQMGQHIRDDDELNDWLQR
ncbi:MAG: ATP-dependent DNA helicase [Synoicihabitans sp.]